MKMELVAAVAIALQTSPLSLPDCPFPILWNFFSCLHYPIFPALSQPDGSVSGLCSTFLPTPSVSLINAAFLSLSTSRGHVTVEQDNEKNASKIERPWLVRPG